MQRSGASDRHFGILLGTAALITMFGIGTVGAQGMPPGQQQPPSGQQQPVVTQSDLESFAGAYIKVSRISKSYQPRIGDAESPGRAQQLQQEANEKMTQAVKNEGLTVAEYNQIFESVKQDSALEQELMALIREMQ